ncbi:MAG: TRAP transporter small permease subunit [Deltaproteobacteria bacterium]|nr:TRAP transporter small permease subunit [Deltaproteobacteria bacterium]
MKALKVLVGLIDGINKVVGFVATVFILVLVLITMTDVSLRYLFRAGSVAFQELEWHLYAANFVLAAGWTMLKDGHVRIDILYNMASPRKRAAIDFVGVFLLCIPFCLIVIWSSWPFFVNAWSIREGSPDPGGLPARYILKAMIPLGFSLVLLQSFSQAIKFFFTLTGREDQIS